MSLAAPEQGFLPKPLLVALPDPRCFLPVLLAGAEPREASEGTYIKVLGCSQRRGPGFFSCVTALAWGDQEKARQSGAGRLLVALPRTVRRAPLLSRSRTFFFRLPAPAPGCPRGSPRPVATFWGLERQRRGAPSRTVPASLSSSF